MMYSLLAEISFDEIGFNKTYIFCYQKFTNDS